MSGICKKYWPIGLILLLGLALRLPSIHYGLPYHLFGDEEANVYGALEMIHLHTLLPVFHEAQFALLLYYPPVLAYIYVILFVPAIGLMYLFLHFSSHVSLHGLENMLTLDPSIFFYIGRSLGVILSLADIYMAYLLTLHLFKDKKTACLGALFLATSFFDVTIAPTTHHWIPGIFFSLLSLMLVIKALGSERRRRYLALAGISIGLSFGISYLVYFMPFILAYIAYDAGICGTVNRRLRFSLSRESLRRVIHDWILFLLPCAVVAVIVVAVHPTPLFTQVLDHTAPENGTTRTIGAFVSYYAGVMWDYEPLLLVFSLIGAVILFFRRRDVFCLFGVFFLTAAVLTYAFLFNIARYLMPILPFLSILAGYGLCELVRLIPVRASGAKDLSIRKDRRSRRIAAWSLAVILAAYWGALFGRYELLMLRNDTEVAARNWIDANIPARSVLIVDSERLRFLGTSTSTAFQASVAPQSLRAEDRVMLESDSYAAHPFDLSQLFYATQDEKRTLIDAALAQHSSETYFAFDTWIPNRDFVDQLASRGTVIKVFFGSTGNTGVISLPIGGERGQPAGIPALRYLYSVGQLGPDIYIYNLNGPANP